jgi:aminopeptidase-like protein
MGNLASDEKDRALDSENNRLLSIVEALWARNRVFCSSDYDAAIDYLSEILPFRVIEYDAGDEYNGWVIPPKWDIREAQILKNGELIYDGTVSPLRVIALSTSFRGTVDLEELKRHLHYDSRFEDAVPYHYRQQYQCWDRDWGFCVPRAFYDSLGPGDYSVIIDTDEAPGSLKILEYTHRGATENTFVFVAHLDHPGMANDDLAGCAVGVELLARLGRRNTRYSYRLVLVQEYVGSEYYLGCPRAEGLEGIVGAVFLEMLGTDTQLALQGARSDHSILQEAVADAMQEMGIRYRAGAYRKIISNDEAFWESYGIPTASLSRWPYPEYHCDRDNMSIISQEALEESVLVLLKAVDGIESSRIVQKRFRGNVCLSNPEFDLYVDGGQPAFGTVPENGRKMRDLMELLPLAQYPTSVLSLARQVGLPSHVIRAYLDRWVEKGLLEFV